MITGLGFTTLGDKHCGVQKMGFGPPQFVDAVEYPNDEGDTSDAVPTETIGGVLKIYSALSPTALPREIDLQHLDEVSALIEAVCAFSREQDASFEFELDEVCVGTVDNGEMGNGLADGLLGEWRSYLGLPAQGRIVTG